MGTVCSQMQGAYSVAPQQSIVGNSPTHHLAIYSALVLTKRETHDHSLQSGTGDALT